MSGELSGQVAIVTGGASGIGAASAALLEGQGARVITADLQDAKAGPGRFVSHDVASEESWKSLLADVLESEGRLDIVVNNAGISGGVGNAETTTVENWQHVQAIGAVGIVYDTVFTTAVTDQLAVEHKQWLDGATQTEMALAKLDEALKRIGERPKP